MIGRRRVSALQELEDYIKTNEKGLDTVTKSKLDRAVYFTRDATSHREVKSVQSNSNLEKTLLHFVDHLKNLQKFRSAQLKQVNRLLEMEMAIEEELNSNIAPPSLAQNQLTDEEFESYLLGDDQLHEYEDNQLERFNLHGEQLNVSQFARQSHLRKITSRVNAETLSSSFSGKPRGLSLRYADVSDSAVGVSSQYPEQSEDDEVAPPPPPPPPVEPQRSALQPFLVPRRIDSSSSNSNSIQQTGLSLAERQHESDVASQIRQTFEQQIRDSQQLLARIGNLFPSQDDQQVNKKEQQQQQWEQGDEEEPLPRSPLFGSPKPTTPSMTPSFTGTTTVRPEYNDDPYAAATAVDGSDVVYQMTAREGDEEGEGSDDDSEYWRRTEAQPSFVDTFDF